MKKSKLIILYIAAAVVIIALVITALILTNKPKEIIYAPEETMNAKAEITNVEEFDYDLFEKVINEYAISNVNVGPITDAEVAKEKADKFITEYFSTDIQEGKQLIVSYNKDKDLWFVQCFRSDLTGGFYDVVINSNGDVIAAWHSQ